MNHSLRILRWLYTLCLHLYPRAYRVEYSEELQAVFNLALHEAAQKGGFSVIGMALRELYGLPRAVIFEHKRERGKSRMSTKDDFLTFEPGSWRETIAALAPFLVFGAFPAFLGYLRLSTIAPKWLEAVLALSLLSLLISLFVIGTVKGFAASRSVRGFDIRVTTPASSVLLASPAGLDASLIPRVRSDFVCPSPYF